jgi:hypothetical protein
MSYNQNITNPLGLDIKVKIRPKTKSKIWKEIADVYINGVKRGVYGTNDGFERDYGSSLGLNIPGVSNDTLSPDRIWLHNYILKKLKHERIVGKLSPETRATFDDLISEL